MAICVVVNGPSSVGKSTLVEGLQDLASVPLLRFGADELYRMVPAQWAGGTAGASHGEQGFSYREVLSEHGLPIGRRIHNGPDAVRMLHAMNAGVLGMVTAGHDVIVDGEAYEPEVNVDLHLRLRHAAHRGAVECSIVELTADTHDLLDRQRRHAHPAGLAESQSRQGWICQDPDLHVDTGGRTADAVRQEVWEFLARRHPRLQRPERDDGCRRREGCDAPEEGDLT